MSVIYPHQVAGKTAVSMVAKDGEVVSCWIGNFFKAFFNSAIEEGKGWPDDAMFKLQVRYRTWPCGWEKDFHDSYFTSQEELDQRLEELKDWALCEDNEASIKVWEWDLGPELKGEYHYF